MHAYTPFTVAVVCRVRVVAIYTSPVDVAPHIPLPPAPEMEEGTPVEQIINTSEFGETEPNGPDYILKLYDRRCFMNVRDDFDNGEPYTEMKARAYRKYGQGLPVPPSARDHTDMPGYEEEAVESEKNAGLFEAWLEGDARRTGEREVAVYNALVDLQGRSIPRLYDTVWGYTDFKFERNCVVPGGSTDESNHPLQHSKSPAHDQLPHVFVDRNRVQAILIEFVPGITLRDFVHAALRAKPGLRRDLAASVASIASEVVGLVLEIDRYPVLNRDVRLDNILIRQSYISTLDLDDKKAETGEEDMSPVSVPRRHTRKLTPQADDLDTPIQDGPRCVAIDFGHARVRFSDETDEQWRCAKRLENEEGRLEGELRSEINKIVEEVREKGSIRLGTEEQAEVWEEEGPLWKWERRNAWHRVLSPEEQQEQRQDIYWGHHPDHWR